MLYEDRMAVATPEGVTLEFALAGVGSRFIAGAIDGLLQVAALLLIWLAAAGVSAAFAEWGVAFGIAGTFAVILTYDTAFEVLASGRTPGKRWTGLRVVREGGGPVTFRVSAVRNLLRLVDFLPTTYLVGMVCVLASSKNQRLGDMAAGTLVVRERTGASRAATSWDAGAHAGIGGASPWTGWSAPAEAAVSDELSTWDVSGVTVEEAATVRQFLARRGTLDAVARNKLALELANRLRPKVVAPDERMGPEGFLERLVAAKSERG